MQYRKRSHIGGWILLSLMLLQVFPLELWHELHCSHEVTSDTEGLNVSDKQLGCDICALFDQPVNACVDVPWQFGSVYMAQANVLFCLPQVCTTSFPHTDRGPPAFFT